MSYADHWLKWFDIIEAGAGPVSRRMIELADLAKARQVLDVGTGLGEPAFSAARAIAPAGRVQAIDVDAEMIGHARQRAAAQGLTNVDFAIGDIETAALGEGVYDAILARWSLMFVDDKPAMLEKLVRALRPDGRLVAAAWLGPEDAPALVLAKQTVWRHFGWPASSFVEPRPFAMADVAASRALFSGAGLCDITVECMPVVYEFASPADYIQNRLDLTGPLWEGMERADTATVDGVFRAIEAALEPYRAPEGGYRLVNKTYCIAGRRSAAAEENGA